MIRRPSSDAAIWWFAFGYFASYAPYSALTKALTQGFAPGYPTAVSGTAILPLSAAASLVSMFLTLTLLGWWKFASRRIVFGRSVPSPTIWTFFSGLCSAVIIVTTTLAYTFEGVSIVFIMLLMRGGVLIIAPVVDALSHRRVRWFSWMGLGLSMGALFVAFSDRSGYDITLTCGIDVAAYLGSYFIRLRFMSRMAKTDDPDVTKRYFVEEQMVATPAVMITLALMAAFWGGTVGNDLRQGFYDLPASGAAWNLIIVGLLSQGTGIFGGLILLGKRENTFCVPVNRSSSVLAGVLASYMIAWWTGHKPPSASELTGAAMIIGAILFLTIPPMLERRPVRRPA